MALFQTLMNKKNVSQLCQVLVEGPEKTMYADMTTAAHAIRESYYANPCIQS